MGGEIDGGLVFDELAHTVEGLAGGLDVLEDDTEFVRFQSDVGVGHIAVEHVEETVVLGNDDAVAVGVGSATGTEMGDKFSMRWALSRFIPGVEWA